MKLNQEENNQILNGPIIIVARILKMVMYLQLQEIVPLRVVAKELDSTNSIFFFFSIS